MEWSNLLNNLLYIVLTVVVPFLAKELIKYLKAQFSKIKTETENLRVNDTLAKVFDIITSAVDSTTQTYVDTLKAAGEFTPEAQKIAFETTKNTVLQHLSNDAKVIIISLYGDLNSWLDSQIEATVLERK